MNSKLHNYAFYVLLGLLIWLPIPLGSNRPWAWGLMELVIFSLSLASAYIRKDQAWMGLRAYRLPIALWLGFLVLATIQVIPLPAQVVAFLSPVSYETQWGFGVTQFHLSLDVGQSQINLLKAMSYFCLLIVVLVLVNNEKRLRLLLLTLLTSGAVQALYGTVEILSGTDNSLLFALPVSEVATGSFVYKNHYANFLMLCLSAGIGLMVATLQSNQSGTRRDLMRSILSTLLGSKALIRISLAIMVIALVMSRSRMGNTAFFASMTIIGILALVIIKNRSRSLSILIVSMIVIDVFIVSAWFGLDKVQERLQATSLAQEGRDEVVIDSLPMLQDFPLFGTGGGSFYSSFPSYKVANIQSFYDHAHNDYLQMSIEYGIPATLLLAILVIWCFSKSVRAMRKRRPSIFKGTAFACCMAMLGMAIHMTVDFPLQAPANACYFVVFLALSLLINQLKITTGKKRRSKKVAI
ncbi:O-antigen ligase family protein [uncultured Paraglaciecola sp.]|uniref:O-antigen ligase family protein n=1 Tax=uncultured Paraglaciecola sp. TaxID=1765024 RepID=UPI0030DDC6DF